VEDGGRQRAVDIDIPEGFQEVLHRSRAAGGDQWNMADLTHLLQLHKIVTVSQQALAKTEESGLVTFYSRTKQRLWTKGETSGNVLNVVSITPDCDNDTLLVLVNPVGPTCHTGTTSCFGEEKNHQWLFLYQLEQLLAARKSADPASSYTAKLYASGTKRIAQKVGEEGVETALAATVHDREELTNEASDLIYHLLVLLQDQDLDMTTPG